MSRMIYINGEYVSEKDAVVSIFDRGFLMADAVYEVTAVIDGKMVGFDGHWARLQNSLGELQLACPLTRAEMLAIHRELITRNNLTHGGVYVQITRGNPGDRDYIIADMTPTIVLFTQDSPDPINDSDADKGWRVMTAPDLRWRRRDIKSVQLLYPSLVKTEAVRQGFDDAWLIEDGAITEGTSNNAYIIKDGVIITRALSHDILHGVTRANLLAYAEARQMKLEIRPFTLTEAKNADEAFVTSASAYVMPVVSIDGHAIGDGKPGSHALNLRKIFIEESIKSAL